MRIQQTKYFFVFMAFVFSCSQEKENVADFQSPFQIDYSGYQVPSDSIENALVFVLDNNKENKVFAGNPIVVTAKTNRKLAGEPIVVNGKNNLVYTPGKDSFLLPSPLKIYDSTFIAGMPEIIVAKDGYTKDQNPQNFKSLSKLQGLKHGNIRCLTEDHLGNIWLGTEGGGVSKYDGKSFTHFTENEGLPYNDVRCILQDSKHNIWFGTNGAGIAKYDGKKFVIYKGVDGLLNYDVLCLEEDAEGNIWMGTDGFGAIKYTPSTNEKDSLNFVVYTTLQGMPGDIIWSIERDSAGHLWFGSEEGGMACFDGSSFIHFTKEHGLVGNHILTIHSDREGNLWIGTDGFGISKMSFENNSNPNLGYTFSNYDQSTGLVGNVVSNIFNDMQGDVWIATPSNGACKFVQNNPSGKAYFEHFGIEEGLSNAAISNSLEDKSGNIWFATYGGGIAKYDGKLFTHFTNREGLSSPHIWSMTEDNEGNMWFGTSNNGVCKYDGQHFYNYNIAEGLCHIDIRSMLTDNEGNLWFGSQGKGVSKFTPANPKKNLKASFTTYNEDSGLFGSDVRNMIQDKNGNIWFALSGKGLTKFDGKSFLHFNKDHGLSGNDVRCVVEDHHGNIWIGTNGDGVTKIEMDSLNGQITYSFIHFREKDGFPSDFIICAFEDSAENIWFGTYGKGLIKVTQKKDGEPYTIVSINEEKGLANNFVFSMIEDFSGNLWFGTRFGLSKLSPENLSNFNKKLNTNNFALNDVFFKNYQYEDGFLGIGCNGKSIFQGGDGTIWIGSNDRLTACHPEGENTFADSIAPNIQITGINLFNEKIPWTTLINKKDTSFVLGNGVEVGDFEFDDLSSWYGVPQNLSLSHENNYLTFQFIGITMYQPANVKYQYKLEGFDQNWSAIDKRTEAPYGNLPHGDFTFRVRAMNSAGVWSNEISYSFTIRPPWWKTWWFQTTVVVLVFILLISLYRWRTTSLRRRQKQLVKTVADRTAELLEEKKVAETQKEYADEQRYLVEQKNKEITDSINYAKRIQNAILPSHRILKKYLPESFVLYLPKDIVAGDFYWMEVVYPQSEVGSKTDITAELPTATDDCILFAVADCTGHGVPGAMVSVICNNGLNRSVREYGIKDPGKILDKAREIVIQEFEKSDDEVRDGMDISLCSLNQSTLSWSGANNPLWIIRNGNLIEFKPDKQPIGKHMEAKAFTTHKIELEKNDVIYLFTDGMVDQFGGPKGKKFMLKKLKQLLISISAESMEIQKQKIHDTFKTWKGNLEQVDDVCVIGVRV